MGSTRALTDDSGDATDTYVYDAWGNEVSVRGSTVNPFRWVGQVGYYWDDGTGTFYIRARAQPVRPSTPSVGKLGIHLRPEPSEKPGFRKAKVTLSIQTNAGPVYLTGIVASEVRRGWVNLEIPPLEQWEEPLRWLSRRQRERIEEPSFYELLQREIPRRLLQPAPG